MCFNFNKTKNNYELLRFCSKINLYVIGGVTKLFNFFNKEYKPEKIITYSNKRWNSDNIYQILNFKKIHTDLPKHYYIINNNRKNNYNSNNNKNHKIYDCGSEKWLWNYMK